jgi:hypothetical protein
MFSFLVAVFIVMLALGSVGTFLGGGDDIEW